MIVCLCHRISDRDICREVSAGTQCFDVLQDDTRLASSCGSCHDCAREVFESACAKVRIPTLGADIHAAAHATVA